MSVSFRFEAGRDGIAPANDEEDAAGADGALSCICQ
jgi:hypothetical protein